MVDWCTDMTKAPRGRYRVVSGPNGKGDRRVFERQQVILAGKCGVVTISYYLPDQRRWNMFAAGEQPVAWMPYAGEKPKGLPAHPFARVAA